MNRQPINPLHIDAVTVDETGAMIGMTPCPGVYMGGPLYPRDLAYDLMRIRDWGARALVSLMEREEMEWYGVAELPTKTVELGMQHFHLPIVDMDIPDQAFEESWEKSGKVLRNYLLTGEHIAIHCLGGLGRTGTITARLLIELGLEPQTAIQRIRASRPGAIQTLTQEYYALQCRSLSE